MGKIDRIGWPYQDRKLRSPLTPISVAMAALAWAVAYTSLSRRTAATGRRGEYGMEEP